MSLAPAAVKRELDSEPEGGSPGRKRRKQVAPTRAPPTHSPMDLHAKVADMYKSALAFTDLSLPPAFDPLAAFRLLPRHDPPRIFNPEAYCDLCCKEFCNKYFLKTHRANKHGIYESGEQPSPAPISHQPSPPRRASDEDSGGAPRRLSPESARIARDSGFQPDALRRLGVINPDAFCEICCKEYCNKYFLRTHRERRHGVPMHISPPSSAPPSMLMHQSLTSPITQLETPPPQMTPEPPSSPMVKNEREEDIEASATLREGQTSPLNLIMEERGGAGEISPASASEELKKLQTMISQLNELAAERLVEEPYSGGETGPSSGAGSPTAEERRSNSAGGGGGSSFCEICNKELCNKYFMRTHMQRMHGISLESGAQLGGVTCDICHKELCSKYFLRVHKHNTHGVSATSSNAPAPAEPCPLCPRRFRGARALRTHLLADHAPPPPRPLDLLARDRPYSCSYCPFKTDVLAFLFAHERAHQQGDLEMLPEPTNPPPNEDEESLETNGEVERDPGQDSEGGFLCSRCSFGASSFSELETHVRTSHGGGVVAVPRAGAPLTMQPFVVEQAGGAVSLLPALVYLPVRRRATRRATVTLTLTPA